MGLVAKRQNRDEETHACSLVRLTMMYGKWVGTSTSGEEIWRPVVGGGRCHHEWAFIDPKVRSRSYEDDDKIHQGGTCPAHNRAC